MITQHNRSSETEHCASTAATGVVTSTAQRFIPQCVLVTGAAGFAASHLVDQLLREFPLAQVVGIDKMSYCSTMRNLDDAKQLAPARFKFVQLDICDADALDRLFATHCFDAVMHLAAMTHVDNSFGNSLAFTRDNVIGTHTLLEVARKHNCLRRFLHMSTDEIAPPIENLSTEESPTRPTNPYSASKAAAEAYVYAYHHSFRLPAVIVRGNNIIGPRQYPEKATAKFILRLRRGLPCCVHGSGAQRRSFMYIDDMVEALSLALQYGRVGEIYNIGIDHEYTVIELAHRLIALVHGPATNPSDHIQFVEDRNFNDQRYSISTEKFTALTGWRPKILFDDALQRIVQWYSRIDPNQYWSNSPVDTVVHNAHGNIRV